MASYRPTGDEIRTYMAKMDVGLLEAKEKLTKINRGRALYELRFGPHLPDVKTKDRLDQLLDILLDDEKVTSRG